MRVPENEKEILTALERGNITPLADWVRLRFARREAELDNARAEGFALGAATLTLVYEHGAWLHKAYMAMVMAAIGYLSVHAICYVWIGGRKLKDAYYQRHKRS